MLFWHLQSKIAQIQTVKIFWQSKILSTLHPFYISCSVHECLIIWQTFLGSKGLVRVSLPFIGRDTGVTGNLQTGIKIHFQISFMWIHQGKSTLYCSLLHVMSIKTCLINQCLSSASAVTCLWFIYELHVQKSTTIVFSRTSLSSYYSRNPTCEIPPYFWISNGRTECKTMLSDDLRCFSVFSKLKVPEILHVVFSWIETHHLVFFWLVCSSFLRNNVCRKALSFPSSIYC